MRTFPLALPIPATAAKAALPDKAGLLRRLVRSMTAARQRQAEREVARWLAVSGMKFTDAAEREIERRFLAPHPFHSE